ncbi:hypothetical protein NDU88_002296 [Pleurodeles waltl]|uniref:Dynein light chain n=1 Tax=Pleurodeles waltl TaxID=8319 RepID=A0AAV7UAT7_PLEWA|nr:hypothetical protein NDU88_002296 [Pleurodeles waltl]
MGAQSVAGVVGAGLCYFRGRKASELSAAVTGEGRAETFAVWEGDATASSGYCHSFTMSDRKAVIKNADMSEDMQQDAVDCATQAMEKYNIEKDIAAYIKKEFDKKYNPTWHCIVGRNFGSYVTHETKHFIYFYLGQVAILLFKSG